MINWHLVLAAFLILVFVVGVQSEEKYQDWKPTTRSVSKALLTLVVLTAILAWTLHLIVYA